MKDWIGVRQVMLFFFVKREEMGLKLFAPSETLMGLYESKNIGA